MQTVDTTPGDQSRDTNGISRQGPVMMIHADTGLHTWGPGATCMHVHLSHETSHRTADSVDIQYTFPPWLTRPLKSLQITNLNTGQTKWPAGEAAGCHDEGADRLLVGAWKSHTAPTALSGQAVSSHLSWAICCTYSKSLFDIFCLSNFIE